MPRWNSDLERTAFAAAEYVGAAWTDAVDLPGELWVGSPIERQLPTQREPVEGEHIPVLRVQAALVGGVMVVGLNAEPFVRVGQLIERLSAPTLALALGYTNGCFGYLPDREAFELPEGSRGYELEGSLKLFKMPPLSSECVSVTEEAVRLALAQRLDTRPDLRA